MSELNCWEHRKCGKEKGCPAWPDNGRICFSVSKTLCRGETQGHFANKKDKCAECDFYKTLPREY